MRFDNNRYSVLAHAVGRPVEIRAYAERIELRQAGRIVGEHRRHFGRDQTVFDPWHYVPRAGTQAGDAAQRRTVHGLMAVEAACAEALREVTHSADVVLNILARHREPAPPVTILPPDPLRLTHAPVADYARYDSLRRPILWNGPRY